MANRDPLGPVANGRNHAITGIIVALAASKLYAAFPSLSEDQWIIVAGTVIGGVLGFGASMLRSFAAARGGESVASTLGKRAAGWLGCFLAALLLTGCATPIMVIGDAWYKGCDGESVVDAETGDVVCDGKLTLLRGGQISPAGAAALGVPMAVGRMAAGAAIGVP